MSEHEKLLEALEKKYIAEGMSELDARMKAVMSDESQKMVFPKIMEEREKQAKQKEIDTAKHPAEEKARAAKLKIANDAALKVAKEKAAKREENKKGD
jgi:hypothetical protein